MDEKELLLKQIQDMIADSVRGTITEKDLNSKVAEINKAIADKLDNAAIASLTEGVDKLITASAENAAAIKAMTEKTHKEMEEKPKSFKDALIASVMEKATVSGLLTEKNDDYGKRLSLKEYFSEKGNKTTPVFVIKTEMLESSIVQENVATGRLTDLDAQRVGTPLALYPHVTDWMPSKTIVKPTMSILVVYTYVDGSATKTEGSTSSISSFLLKTVEFKSFYIATFFTLSEETLDDLNEVMEEIASVGPDKILSKIDGYILGTAGDDATAIGGLLSGSVTKHTDFASATTYADTVAGATEVDALAVMKLQAEASGYMPDTVILGPLSVAKLASKKDELNNSITDRRVVFGLTGEPTSVAGMQIVKTAATAFATDAAVVLDRKQLIIGKRKDMTMEIGLSGADLVEGQKTVVIKARLAFGVRDPLAVIYAVSLDAAVTDIDIV